jgi:DNA-binding response OmpR family regulator
VVQRVLIIDDEESILSLLETRFRREGIDVMTASTAAEGVQLALERRPDLIILDMRLADEEDASLQAVLRQDAATAAIPIILLSASTDASEGEVADNEADMLTARLRKPFRPSQLLALARDRF